MITRGNGWNKKNLKLKACVYLCHALFFKVREEKVERTQLTDSKIVR